MYVGEFGVVRWAPNAEKYIEDNIAVFDKYGWDWTFHGFRGFHGWDPEVVDDITSRDKAKKTTARGKVLLKSLKKNQFQ